MSLQIAELQQFLAQTREQLAAVRAENTQLTDGKRLLGEKVSRLTENESRMQKVPFTRFRIAFKQLL